MASTDEFSSAFVILSSGWVPIALLGETYTCFLYIVILPTDYFGTSQISGFFLSQAKIFSSSVELELRLLHIKIDKRKLLIVMTNNAEEEMWINCHTSLIKQADSVIHLALVSRHLTKNKIKINLQNMVVFLCFCIYCLCMWDQVNVKIINEC